MLLNYLTEIISKKDWDEQYKDQVFSKIDMKFYKRALKFVKNKIFTPANLSDKRFIFINASGEKTNKSNIVKYPMDDGDRKIIRLINDNTKYKIPKGREASLLTISKVLKGKELVDITYAFTDLMLSFNNASEDVQKQLKSRQDALNKAANDYLTTGDEKFKLKAEAIKKRIDQEKEKNKIIDKVELNKLVDNYKAKVDKLIQSKYLIVLSYDPRVVASQSTKVSWRSCMNLDNGEYNRYVSTSMNIGTFVAYLATSKDKKTLDNPVARVLCKAYYGEDENNKNPDVIWYSQVVYPRDKAKQYAWFPKAVQNFLNQNNKPKYLFYTSTEFNYSDGEPSIIRATDLGFSEDSVIKNNTFVKSLKEMKRFKPESMDDLDDSERDRVYELAWELAMDDFNWDSLDDSYIRREFHDEEDTDSFYRDLAENIIKRDEYEDQDDYEVAVEKQIDELRDSGDYIDEYIDANYRRYSEHLRDLFENNPGDFIDLTDYIDDAFLIYLDNNY